MAKTYNVYGSIKEWLKTNRLQIHLDILEAAEVSRELELLVFQLRSHTGVTSCLLKGPEAVVKSLQKCENAFVELEEYELAARARDCGLYWKEQAEIYKEKSQV
jgi:hypothetical protein